MPPAPAGVAGRRVPPDWGVGIAMVEWSIPAMALPAGGGGDVPEGVVMFIVEWSIPAMAESFAGAPRAVVVSVARLAVVGAGRGSSSLPLHDVSSTAAASSDFRQNLIEWLMRSIG